MFVRGEQHNNMPKYVWWAKYFKLEKLEAKMTIKSLWQGKWEEEKSFEDAWRSPKIEPSYFYDDNKQQNNEEPEIKLNKTFLKVIEATPINEMSFDETDTSILKWWFKQNDLIHITSNKKDKCEITKDVKVLMDKEIPMKCFQLFSIAAFRDMDGKRQNANVKENRLLLLECDKLPLDTQKKFFFSLIEYGLPVKSITYSGGKSYHCLLKIRPMKDVEEYKRYCEDVFKELNKLGDGLVDKANKDGVRYSRAPFGYREDKKQIQKLIWCDKVNMDDEDFTFEDTLQQIKKYVSMFVEGDDEVPHFMNANGHIIYDYILSLKRGSGVENIFLNNGTFFIKTIGQELQRSNKADIWMLTNQYLRKDVLDIVMEGKDGKNKKVTIDDFSFVKKDIVYDISAARDNKNIYNLYEPGFYEDCINMDVKEMPSEFDKLLRNLADSRCYEWLVNHLACYFRLLQNGFSHPLKGDKHTLETIPVFYGKSGTGKNTLVDVIGRAICKKGSMDISIGNLNDDFNEFYKAGLININEAAKGRTERKATKEALKRFTDLWKQLNQKFMPKVDLFNGAYKCISANESDFGVLDIDTFDRRFQYITGGGQLDARANKLCDMNLLHKQEKEFIAYLLHYPCDFDKAETVFDNEAKTSDKLLSMSQPEMVAYWLWENAEFIDGEWFSARTGLKLYNERNGSRIEFSSLRTLGQCLSKYFTVKKQWAKKSMNIDDLQKGEYAYEIKSAMKLQGDIEEM